MAGLLKAFLPFVLSSSLMFPILGKGVQLFSTDQPGLSSAIKMNKYIIDFMGLAPVDGKADKARSLTVEREARFSCS